MDGRKGRIRGLALCLAFALTLTSLTGCAAASDENEEYRLTPEADFSQSAEAKDEAFRLTSAEAAPVGDFSLAFMREALEQAKREGAENPVLSPISVYLALTLAAVGSDGKSREEFEQALRLPADEWGSYGGQLMRFMNRSGDAIHLATGNSLWVDEGMVVAEEYIRCVSEEMYSEVFEVDLSTEQAQQAINRWVNRKTDGMIPEFLEKPYDDSVWLAILNAVYLEARWEDPFSEEETITKPFYTEGGEEIAARFLSEGGCWRDYIGSERLEGILLPYRDSSLAFVALRATDGRTPRELLDSLTLEELRRLAAGAVSTRLNFSMPKFTLEYEQDLLETMSRLGLQETMTPGRANLSAMVADPAGEGMYSCDIRQKVKIQVDEEGTKAAAVTELTAAGGAAVEESPRELHLDSPYLYAVIDQNTGIPLFMGIMENPPAAQE